MMKKEYTGILLCGGKSTRMGRDKYALLFNNKPMYAPALDTLHKFSKEVLISSNKVFPEFVNYLILHDEVPDIGPMGGLYTCLKFSKTEYNIVLACDMPLVSGTLMAQLVEVTKDYDAIVPVVNNRPEPLYAIYNKLALPILEKCIESGNYSLLNMLQAMNVCYVTTSFNFELKNVNTPAELALYGQ